MGNLLELCIKRSNKSGNISRKGVYKRIFFNFEIKYAFWDDIDHYSVWEKICQSSFKVSQCGYLTWIKNLAQKEVKKGMNGR